MADILKITTPLVNKNQPVQMKPGAEPLLGTDIQNVSKVIQPNAQSELLNQHNGMIQQGDRPTILANLLKDPAVTAAYVKNIFMLEEIIKLLPANNRTMTEEIERIIPRTSGCAGGYCGGNEAAGVFLHFLPGGTV